MKKKEYSSEQRKEIVRLYQEEKLSKEKIGKKFDCSEIVIDRIIKEEGIPSRKSGTISNVETDEILQLLNKGVKPKQIAAKHGITQTAITQRVSGLVNFKRGPDPKLSDLELYILHVVEKRSIADISKEFYGIPFSTSLRDRAIALGFYSQNHDWLEDRKNPIQIHDGYAFVKIPEHPRANKKGYVLQHRFVMEQTVIRRPLKYDGNQPIEVVHHINGDKKRNPPSNLVLCKSNSEHRKIHNQLDSTLSKLVKCGTIVFDFVQRKYVTNYENPKPPKKRKINPTATKHATKTGGYYLEIYLPGHHRADERGRVLEHIPIAEKKEGRKIYENEPIHHIDGDKSNNSSENLLVCRNKNEHDQVLRMQLNWLVRYLMGNKKLFFNKETKQYYTEKK